MTQRGAHAAARHVTIHYTRPPGRLTVFRQRLVHSEAGCVVTLLERTPLERPVHAGGTVILTPDAPVVWFTFEGLWHDIGRFHAGGEFTGCYANVITPVHFRSATEWATTDLFLDVWLGADGTVLLLDEEELDQAEAAGALTAAVARRARREAARVLEAAGRGSWPPPVVHAWTLARALDVLAAEQDGQA